MTSSILDMGTAQEALSPRGGVATRTLLWMKSWLALWIAGLWLLMVMVLSLTAGALPIDDPAKLDLLNQLATPGPEAWLGTDSLGRDLLSRVIHGGQVSLLVGIGSVALGLFAGSTLGIVAGYFKGWLDRAVMAMMDIMLAFPSLILAISIVAYLGASTLNVIVAIGLLFIPAFARIARANTMTLRDREFVQVALVLGASDLRILTREILPNLVGVLLSYSLVMFAVAVLAEASLGFLGLSVPAPMPSWGGMVASERGNMDQAMHVVLVPGMVMFFTVMAFNALGEHVQRIFDIKDTAL